MMNADQQLRNLRDFLLVYNRMTEICFQRCTTNFNYRYLTMDEERCTDNCAGKLIRSNHRLMSTYVQLMPKMVQRRMEEMETKAAENAKAAEASAGGADPAGIVTSEAPHTFEAPLTSSLPPQDPLVPDASLPTPPGLNATVEVAETRPPAMLSHPESGLSLVADLPNTLPVGSQMDSKSSASVFAPPKAPSLAEDTLVLTPVVPQSESPSGQEKSP